MFSSGSPWTPKRVSRRGHRRGDPPVPAHAVEHLLVLRHLRQPRRLDARRERDAGAPTHVLDRWMRSRLHRTVRTRHRRARAASTRSRGAQALGDVRRRPLQLVRAPRRGRGSGSVATRGARDAAPSASSRRRSSSRRSARSSPTSIYIALTGERRCTSPTGPRRRAATTPTLEAEMHAVAPARVARAAPRAPTPRSKVRQPLRRALLLHPGIELVRRCARRDRRRAQREGARATSTPLGPLTGRWCRTSARSARGSAQGDRREGALAAADGADAARGARARRLRRGRRRAARPPTTSRCAPTAHEELALAQDGAYAVALDLELDDDLRSEGIARELVRAVNDLRKAVGLELADRVTLVVSGPDAMLDALAQHQAWIAGEVLAYGVHGRRRRARRRGIG